jgi:hypothetical protein
VTLTASLLLGALLGAAHAVASVATARRARLLPHNESMRVVMRGMLVRLTVGLASVAAVLAWVPVMRGSFLAGLGVVFLCGLVAEAALALRKPATA